MMRNERRRSSGARGVALGLLLSTALAACGAPRGTSQNTLTGGPGLETEAEIGNRELRRKLEMRKVVHRRLQDERLQVQFELHNKTRANVELEWTIHWADAAGFRIDTASNWRPLVLGGNEREVLTSTGPTPAASTWELDVRTPNTVR